MSIWNRLFRRAPAVSAPEEDEATPPPGPQPVRLPDEPFVFECRTCGKVFESRRLRAMCPECDSRDVEMMAGEL